MKRILKKILYELIATLGQQQEAIINELDIIHNDMIIFQAYNKGMLTEEQFDKYILEQMKIILGEE